MKNKIDAYAEIISRSSTNRFRPKLLNESYDELLGQLQHELTQLKSNLESKTTGNLWGGAGGGASTSLDLYRPTKIVSINYNVTSRDYYIGVNATETVTITLPVAKNGRELIIKDESGFASSVPITIVGNIDNETSVILKINNGSMTFLYRDGWRII